MPECLKCGRPAEYCFHVLEVRTLHIRDLSGERRVQALGKLCDYAVCETCAAAYLEQILHSKQALVKACIPYAIVGVLGIVLTVVFWGGNAALRLMGLSAIACGVLGLVSTVRKGTSRRRDFRTLSEEEALERAAWECMLESAPKKAGDSDLTYIPVNSKTLAMETDGLMVRYHLLPKIAVQAGNILRRAPIS